jgi:hypothetical protein
MERLARTVPNWLPAAARVSGGKLEIMITLTLDEIGVMKPDRLSVEERIEARALAENLENLLRSLEEE